MKNICLFYQSIQKCKLWRMIILKNSINVVINKNHISLRGLIITTYSMQFLRIYNKVNTIYYTIFAYKNGLIRQENSGKSGATVIPA